MTPSCDQRQELLSVLAALKNLWVKVPLFSSKLSSKQCMKLQGSSVWGINIFGDKCLVNHILLGPKVWVAGCIKHLMENSNLDIQRSFLRYINFIFGIAFIIVLQCSFCKLCSLSSFKICRCTKGNFVLFKFLL